MKLFSEYRRTITEVKASDKYSSGRGLTATITTSPLGVHTAKFKLHGKPQNHSDFSHKDKDEVEDFVQNEMDIHRKENTNESTELNERIHEPQGHKYTKDPITKDTNEGDGVKKKMMGNRTPLEIIAKLLAGK